MRVAGAGHTPEQLAKIAYRKHVRLARLEGGALGVGGILTAAPDIVALLWIQSRMVFYIAAAYRYDPRSWYYKQPGYYPFYESSYWVPRAEMRYRYRGQYYGPKYHYYPSWGYPLAW